MAITNGYMSLEDFKARQNPEIDEPDNDTQIENVIEAVSRTIDQVLTKRRGVMTRFYTTASDETRIYRARFEDLCVIDDLLTVTSVKTDTTGDGTYDTTLTAYRQLPVNNGLDTDEPSYALGINPGGTSFSLLPYGVEVVGTFGFSTEAAQPDAINEACFLAASRLWARRDSLFGLSGTTAIANDAVEDAIIKDPEIMLMLDAIPDRPTGLRF